MIYARLSDHSSVNHASIVSPTRTQPFHPQAFAGSLVGLGPVDDTIPVTSPSERLIMKDTKEVKSLEKEHHEGARSHPFYSKKPDADGLYHCPSEGKTDCNHKPAKRKCDYE